MYRTVYCAITCDITRAAASIRRFATAASEYDLAFSVKAVAHKFLNSVNFASFLTQKSHPDSTLLLTTLLRPHARPLRATPAPRRRRAVRPLTSVPRQEIRGTTGTASVCPAADTGIVTQSGSSGGGDDGATVYNGWACNELNPVRTRTDERFFVR